MSATTNMDPYAPVAGDVVGTEAWADGNREVVAAAISERALKGYTPTAADTVTYYVLGESGHRKSGPFTEMFEKWLDWVEGPGYRDWICNEQAE